MSPYDLVSFSDFFDIPKLSRKYQRPFSEYNSMKSVQLDNGTTKAFFNVIGHKKEDVEVTVTSGEYSGKWYLNVNAQTEREHLGKFATQYSIPVTNKIAKIEGVVENGLLELTIEWDKTSDPDVEVVIK